MECIGEQGKTCLACEQGEASGLRKLAPDEARQFLDKLPLWRLAGGRIERSFVAKSFASAMDFLNKVAAVAEREGHHPDVHLTEYRNVKVVLWTHSMNGLTQNDFTLACLIDALPVAYSPKWLREQPEAVTAAAVAAAAAAGSG